MAANSFIARTRARGEIDYYNAIWREKRNMRGGYEVEFINGPHRGKKYVALDVAKAKEN